jgi:hypothetical protein
MAGFFEQCLPQTATGKSVWRPIHFERLPDLREPPNQDSPAAFLESCGGYRCQSSGDPRGKVAKRVTHKAHDQHDRVDRKCQCATKPEKNRLFVSQWRWLRTKAALGFHA